MIADRRARRAHAPLLAAEYFLDRQRERCGAGAVALFDGREMLAVSAASNADPTTLRMWVGEVARGGPGPSRDVFVHPVQVLGRVLHLASIDARVPSVREAERGLARILDG